MVVLLKYLSKHQDKKYNTSLLTWIYVFYPRCINFYTVLFILLKKIFFPNTLEISNVIRNMDMDTDALKH